MLAAGVAWAGTIIGTPRADVLRGTPGNDKIYGKAGNDRLYGRGGKDLLVGGPGADLLACGSGRDVAIAERRDEVSRDCEVVKGRPKPSPPPPPPPAIDRLYIALGDSTSTSIGASSPSKSWVRLYYGHLASSAGVTRLENLAQPGQTTTGLRERTLPSAVGTIDGSDDTLRVTITIGGADICVGAFPGCPEPARLRCRAGWRHSRALGDAVRFGLRVQEECGVKRGNSETRIADNLRAILTALNDALARDPGDETIQIMEYYNFDIGTARESATRASLLGSDLEVDCSGTGGALGLNDLIHCIALEENALPVDVLPAFDAGGEAFLAPDHVHANDAGHRAIALAFGGAVERP